MALNYLYELSQLILGCFHSEFEINRILKRKRDPKYLVFSECKRCGIIKNYLLMDINNLDKTGWEKFRFEEIAQKISETVDPNTTELKTYVGLEHIDPEDIHIKHFGTPEDVSGGKLKCYPGDVIFGKRRAYQRKAAIVDFEGICSAHAFVFRANPKVIDPKLFPFFLHSDQFMHRAVDISVGGLSPTINWGDLKHQEFLLPPKEEQAKLAELL